MSEQELIVPDSLLEDELLSSISLDGSNEEEEELSQAAPQQQQQPPPPQQKLSTFLQDVEKLMANLSPKKLKEAIVEVSAANKKVHQFSAGEKFISVVKEAAGATSAKKLRAEWANLRYAFLVEAKLTDGSTVFGYVSSGKKDELAHLPIEDPARFVLVPVANLGMFHAPSFDPSRHVTATQQDQRSDWVSVTTPSGVTQRVKMTNFDPRFILRAAKNAQRRSAGSGGGSGGPVSDRPPKAVAATTASKRKETTRAADLGARVIASACKFLLGLQRRDALCNVAVLLDQSPHYKTLRAELGAERFPVLRSEDADGLRLMPYDIGGDIVKLAECLKGLRTVQGQSSSRAGRWETEPILRALLVQQMAVQFCTLPAAHYLRDSGMALSELNIAAFLKDFTADDRGRAYVGDVIVYLFLVQEIFNELVALDHELLRTAAPLLAFAASAERLGPLRVEQFRFDEASMRPAPTLRCALTDSVIVPGMPFYLLCARGRPTDTLPVGQTMIAIVAKSVHEADMRLYPTVIAKRAATAAAAPSSVSDNDAPVKKTSKGSKALTPDEIEAKKHQRNARERERRRLAKEAAEAAKRSNEKDGDDDEASSPSPPPTPVPSPKKKKRPAPAQAPPANEPAAKKNKGAADTNRASFVSYIGVSPVLDKAQLVLNGSEKFNAFAHFATSDPSVNQAMEVFLARTPKTWDKTAAPSATFMAWLKANPAIFVQLATVFQEFTCNPNSFDEELREAFKAAKHRLENGEPKKAAAPADDDNSDAQAMADVDDETLAFLRELGADVPEKKAVEKEEETTGPVVKYAPARDDDPLFAEFVTVAAKKPRTASAFFTALGNAGRSALTLNGLLKIVKATSPEGTGDEALKKTLGNTLAAFKWLFPKASQ